MEGTSTFISILACIQTLRIKPGNSFFSISLPHNVLLKGNTNSYKLNKKSGHFTSWIALVQQV